MKDGSYLGKYPKLVQPRKVIQAQHTDTHTHTHTPDTHTHTHTNTHAHISSFLPFAKRRMEKK